MVHGVHWSLTPPFRWVADAVTIIKNTGKIDWNRLFEQAQKRKLIFPIKEGLKYLQKNFNANIPDSAIEQFEKAKATQIDKWEYKLKTMDHRKSPLGNLPVLGIRFLRWSSGLSLFKRIYVFPKFIRSGLGQKSLSGLFVKAFKMIFKRLCMFLAYCFNTKL